jgi:thiamine kinase-like enzyme
MWFFTFIVKMMLLLPRAERILYDVLPYDILEFLTLFERQLDMIHEANNLCKFKHIYRDNSKIIIPNLVACSHNIVIMTYQEGVTIDDTTLSDYEKMKYFTLLYLFSRNNFQINDFNHGDLHKGNWKVTTEGQVVIYDFGYCFSVSNPVLIDLICSALVDSTQHNYSLLQELLCESFKDYSEDTVTIINNYLEEYLTDALCDPENILISICSIAKLLRKRVDPSSLQAVIVHVQNFKYLTKYSINNNNEQWTCSDNIYRSDYLNYYTICKTYDIFPKLQKCILDTLNEKQTDVKELFDMLNQNNTITTDIKSLLRFD